MASILILCREPTADVNALEKQLLARGYHVLVGNPSQITVQMGVGSLDFWFNDLVIRPNLVFGWASLHHRARGEWLMSAFEMAGIKVINSAAALALGQNKFAASALMSKLGIPHIPTWLIGSLAQLQQAVDALQFPLVIKPVYGSKGQGVALIDNLPDLEREAAQYFSANLPVYLQQRISKPDRDIRVRVIDYVADFAFYRYAANGEFITNLCQGGEFSPAQIDPELGALSERCARAFHAAVAGIDICEDEAGSYRVIEVNMTPAITWPYQATVEKVCQLIDRTLDS